MSTLQFDVLDTQPDAFAILSAAGCPTDLLDLPEPHRDIVLSEVADAFRAQVAKDNHGFPANDAALLFYGQCDTAALLCEPAREYLDEIQTVGVEDFFYSDSEPIGAYVGHLGTEIEHDGVDGMTYNVAVCSRAEPFKGTGATATALHSIVETSAAGWVVTDAIRDGLIPVRVESSLGDPYATSVALPIAAALVAQRHEKQDVPLQAMAMIDRTLGIYVWLAPRYTAEYPDEPAFQSWVQALDAGLNTTV